MRRVAVAEAKAKLSELLGEVLHRGERVVIERRGKPVAALVPMADLERAEPEVGEDWVDKIAGLCKDCPEVCDEIDKVYAERQLDMPREFHFPWEDDDDPA